MTCYKSIPAISVLVIYFLQIFSGVAIGLIKIQVPDFRLVTKFSFKKGILSCKYMWEACGVLEFERFGTKKEAEAKIYKTLKEPAKK